MTARGIKRALAELESISLPQSTDAEKGKARALDSAYNAAMQRIENQASRDIDLARLILSWIACSKRPLTSLELRHAAAVDIKTESLEEEDLADVDDLVSVCAGLVIVDQESDTVRLVHYTAQEYFDRSWKQWFPDAHVKIVQISITYLNFQVFDTENLLYEFFDFITGGVPGKFTEKIHEQLESFPLCRYAANFWGHHARGTSMERDPLVLNFLQRSSKMSLNIAILYMSDQIIFHELARVYPLGQMKNKMTGLQVAAYFGLLESAIFLIEKDRHFLSKEGNILQRPLIIAVNFGWASLTELLYDKGARFETELVKTAIRNDDQEILSLLIMKGLVAFESSDQGYGMGMRTLDYAVELRRDKLAKMLLAQATKPNPTRLVKSMVKAISNGSTEILKLLLDNGAMFEPHSGKTPLSLAVEMGQKNTVRWILQSEASFMSQPPTQNTLLSSAVSRGFYEIAFMLLFNGAIPEDDSLKTDLLFRAAKSDTHNAVTSLIELQTDIEVKSSDGCTALWYAIEKGHSKTVQILIDNGANFEGGSRDGSTALWLAIKEGHSKIAQILIENGADVEGRNRDGESMFEYALRYQNPMIVRLIKERLSQLSTVSSDTDLEPSDCELDLDSD